MQTHLVWARKTTGETVSFYIGEDAVQADQIYHEHHLDGSYDSVKWCFAVPHQKHTTPARDGCPEKVPSDECRVPSVVSDGGKSVQEWAAEMAPLAKAVESETTEELGGAFEDDPNTKGAKDTKGKKRK